MGDLGYGVYQLDLSECHDGRGMTLQVSSCVAEILEPSVQQPRGR